MLEIATQLSNLAFNVLSSLALLAAAVWFSQKKKFDSQCHVESDVVYLSQTANGDIVLKYTMIIRNLSEKPLWVNQIFVSPCVLHEEVKTGAISHQSMTEISPLFEIINSYFIIVSGAVSQVSGFIVVPQKAPILVVRWYLVPRKRPRIAVNTHEQLLTILEGDRYKDWFFDDEVIAVDRVRPRIDSGDGTPAEGGAR